MTLCIYQWQGRARYRGPGGSPSKIPWTVWVAEGQPGQHSGLRGGAGDAGSRRTPLGLWFAGPTGSGGRWEGFRAGGPALLTQSPTRPVGPGLDAASSHCWDGPFDALGIEFPTGGVRSVDNYVRPAQ